MSGIEARLAERGITLAVPRPPAANYLPVRRSGRILYVSGQISADATGVIAGQLGRTMDLEAGRQAARAAAIALLAHIRHSAGVPLEEIAAILRLLVLVNAAPTFVEPHLVANGASDLLVEILGDAGRHARSAIGVASLPLGAAVEIEAVVELKA